MVFKYRGNIKIIILACESALYLCDFYSDVNCRNKFF